MPQPKLQSVHIDRAITEAAIRYRNQMYIADQFAPVINVDKESNDYFIFDKSEWFRDVADDDRRPGTHAPRGGFTLSTDKYLLREIAMAMAVPDRIAENADEPLRPYEDAAEWCMQMNLLRRERRAASNFFGTGIWGTDNTLSGTDQWSDFSNSDPASDLETAKGTILQNTGFEPNTFVVGYEVFQQLRQHPDGLDRYKHTTTGVMSADMVADWLGVERLLVGRAVHNSAAEGQTASMAYVWGKNALVAYVADSPTISEPSAAYIFQKDAVRTRRFREDGPEQEVVEVTLPVDLKVTATDCGYFFNSAVA